MNGRWQSAVGSWQRAAALAAALASFAVVWVVLTLINDQPQSKPRDGVTGTDRPDRSTDGKIRLYERQVADGAGGTGTRALLAEAYLQKLREGGDGSLYERAAGVLRGIEGDSAVETARATLALVKHDFHGGLRHGLEARRLSPGVSRPLTVIADAQVELGRYDDAARTLQTLMDEKPNLAAYARVSYFRELHGDLEGAVEAMRLAVSAGGAAPENVAYVQSLVGNLAFDRGRLPGARHAYRTALARVPAYPGAQRGLARLDAARGRFGAALPVMRELAAGDAPVPEDVIALGEAELAAGQNGAGRRTLARAREVLRAEAIAGTANANERALVEADFGNPSLAIRLGRRGWDHAPSIVSADAIGWAYTRAGRPDAGLTWARRALGKTGSDDRLFLYHAGIAARDAGRPALAERWLSRAVEGNPRFSPLHGRRAERALAALRQTH